jgi:hypothetical protein
VRKARSGDGLCSVGSWEVVVCVLRRLCDGGSLLIAVDGAVESVYRILCVGQFWGDGRTKEGQKLCVCVGCGSGFSRMVWWVQ